MRIFLSTSSSRSASLASYTYIHTCIHTSYIHTYAVSDVLVGTSFDPMTFKALPPQQVASVLAEEEAKLADLDNERETKV